MTGYINRKWVLASRPEAAVSEQNFSLIEEDLAELKDGEFVVKNRFLSFEPAQRGWVNDVPSYIPAVAIGEVMRAVTVGEVVASRHSGYQVGDRLQGGFGWQEYAISSGKELLPVTRIAADVPWTYPLHIFGLTGMTAYFGMQELAQPRAGEVVLVSGAAGSTGSIAGQLAKLAGATVIGIAGGPEKCRWLLDELKFDAVIDYKNQSVAEQLGKLCKNNIDVFFDNVGGTILDDALLHLANNARVVLCGGISSGYQLNKASAGLQNYMQLVIRRARMEGFIVLDYVDRYPEAIEQLQAIVERGELLVKEDVVEGIEQCPQALAGLFSGKNFGKQLLRL
jgi:NADPH-dependent curcumin reductase CurA